MQLQRVRCDPREIGDITTLDRDESACERPIINGLLPVSGVEILPPWLFSSSDRSRAATDSTLRENV
jgi:hypothetical protein